MPPTAAGTPGDRSGRRRPKRRDPGDGAIFQRANGRWVARIQLPDGRHRYFYGQTKDKVRARLREAQRYVEDSKPLPDEKLSLEAYLARWLEGLPATDLKPRTIDTYRGYVKANIIGSPLGRKPLARITPQDLRDLYAAKLAQGLRRSTVHHLHAILHRGLAIAAREGQVARNVAELVDAPGLEKREMKVLQGDQPERFLAALVGEPLEALFVVAVTAGLRQGELLALRWGHVDLDQGELEVVGSLSGRNREDRQIVTPKTGKGRRVSLAPPAITALRAHRRRQREFRVAAGSEWHDRNLVFCDETTHLGDFMEPSSLNRALARILEKAELPAIRFHDLRHTAATRMLSRGVHPKIASEMLGHSSIQVTLDRYSHVTSTMQRDAVRLAWGGHEKDS